MVTIISKLSRECTAQVWNTDSNSNHELEPEIKFSLDPMSDQQINNTFERVNVVPRTLSSYLKLDAAISGLGMGLLAAGTRLRRGVSITWLQNPMISKASIYAGFGLFACSTASKVMTFCKLDFDLFRVKYYFSHEVRHQEACLQQHEEWRQAGDQVVAGLLFPTDVKLLKFIQFAKIHDHD